MRKAVTAKLASSVRPSAQPITRRENASSTTARYTNSVRKRMYVMSAIQSWLIAVGVMSRARFG